MGKMQIAVTQDAALIGFQQGRRVVRVLVVHGLDQVERVLKEQDSSSVGADAAILGSFASIPDFPLVATRPPVSVTGSAAAKLMVFAQSSFEHQSSSDPRMEVARAMMNVPDPKFFFQTHPKRGERASETIVGFQERHREHHVAVFYSLEQARRLLHDKRWLTRDAFEFRVDAMQESGLPEHSDQPVVEIVGSVARMINEGQDCVQRLFSFADSPSFDE